MPFGLKNASTIYQRAMNAIFHELIDKSIEVYTDDIVIKSRDVDKHLNDLGQAFIRIRLHNLKMNLAKCVFGVLVGNFLDFLVHHKGIKMDKNKTKVILEAAPP